jgi:hypothetical protein
MTSIPASAIHEAQHAAKAATAEQALAQVQANQASQQRDNETKPSAANPPGVGGLVDRTA